MSAYIFQLSWVIRPALRVTLRENQLALKYVNKSKVIK